MLVVYTNHKDKKLLLCQAFKERFGTSDFSGFWVDSGMFIERPDFLGILEQGFSESEIDNVMKALPNDKSPAHDGFNNEFLKRCWPIINSD